MRHYYKLRKEADQKKKKRTQSADYFGRFWPCFGAKRPNLGQIAGHSEVGPLSLCN